MSNIKQKIKSVLGPDLSKKLVSSFPRTKSWIKLISNVFWDGMLFYRHSMVFKQDSFFKVESRIILHYHGIEKGFLHINFRYRFAVERIKELIALLYLEDVVRNKERTQIAAAYLAMCKYYERHDDNNVDISDYYSKEAYEFFKTQSTLKTNITLEHNKDSYLENSKKSFLEFSNSRCSVRSFNGEKISLEKIEKVVEIAKNAPSVCNRQPTRVYYVDNKEKISKILKIQGGLSGHTEGISQLMLVVSNRNYFYTVGERNQLYVDGGLFLMNLLYALHYYGIAACPLHWGHNKHKDKEIMDVISLSEAEKVICVVPIGIPKAKFNTTLSLRRDIGEILKVV